ncbi:hypothetical protein AKJ09_05636 [Labilithrix luteola]|uniref:Uncharacterized protein n=1 Tax=Labilithrix luteola TaxID=1391654 RepID=A0A0K1PZQ4_9BACT|nr:hypothetical protein AKJ09_05636 [Labilithrix luteola]
MSVPLPYGFSATVTGESAPAQPFMVVTPEDARLVMASSAIASRVGHDITYDIDQVILKDTTNLHDLVSTALETVARGIDEARAYAPEATGRTCLMWTALKIELDEKTREAYAFFDERTGTLVLRVPTRATSFATERGVALALAPPT